MNQRHLETIDFLRAVAILGVVLFHAVGVISPGPGWGDSGWKEKFGWGDWAFYGSYGVALFFVISGFCIHWGFLNNSQHTTASFYWRRFWRIYPPYMLAMVVLTAISLLHDRALGQPRTITITDFGAHALFIHNFFQFNVFYGNINGSFWSLANEMQYYLLYPLLLMVRGRWGMRTVVYLALGLSVLLQVILRLRYGADFWLVDLWTFSYWYVWVLGMGMAEAFHRRERFFMGGRPLFYAVAMASGMVTWYRLTAFYLGFTLFGLALAMIFERMLWQPHPLDRVQRALIPLGLCSYSLYLWHQPLLIYGHEFASGKGLFFLCLTIGVIVVVLLPMSWALYKWVELPSIALGKRLWKRVRPVFAPACVETS